MNEITVFYKTNIYPENIIYTAVQRYAGICSIRVEHQGKEMVCVFSDSIADLELTVKEFDNFLIELINSRGMA